MSLGVFVIALSSCGGPSKADYDKAAETMCACMEEKSGESQMEETEFSIDMTDLDYSLCALDVVSDVDIKDDQMAASITEKCPDLEDTHKEYVKGL